MAIHAEEKIHRGTGVVGGEIELFKYFGKKHEQVDDRRNNNDQPQFIEHVSIDFIGGRVMDNRQNKSYQCRSGGKSRGQKTWPHQGVVPEWSGR